MRKFLAIAIAIGAVCLIPTVFNAIAEMDTKGPMRPTTAEPSTVLRYDTIGIVSNDLVRYEATNNNTMAQGWTNTFNAPVKLLGYRTDSSLITNSCVLAATNGNWALFSHTLGTNSLQYVIVTNSTPVMPGEAVIYTLNTVSGSVGIAIDVLWGTEIP